MGRVLAQNSSANVVIGPLVDISGDALAGLTIDNTAIVLIKEASVSVARNAATSALSVGPGMYRIVLNTTDTDTLGTLTIFVSGSAALSYAKDIEIWQSTTWNLYFGSAEQIATSAAVSAIVAGALTNSDIATSADVSVIVSGVLASYNVASAGEVASAGINSAGISAIVQAALVAYDAPTSADVSAVMVQVLTDYDAPTSADVSAIVSAVVSTVLANYDVATSADVSVIVANLGGLTSAQVSTIVGGALTDYDVPTSADVSAIVAAIGGVGSAQVSVIVAGALTNYDVVTSADVSVIVAAVGITSAQVSAIVGGALTNYDVPTSADVSAIVGPAVWNRTATQPAAAPVWASANRGQLADWVGARALNRQDQTSTKLEIFTSAGAAIASASAGDDGSTARRDQFLG